MLLIEESRLAWSFLFSARACRDRWPRGAGTGCAGRRQISVKHATGTGRPCPGTAAKVPGGTWPGTRRPPVPDGPDGQAARERGPPPARGRRRAGRCPPGGSRSPATRCAPASASPTRPPPTCCTSSGPARAARREPHAPPDLHRPRQQRAGGWRQVPPLVFSAWDSATWNAATAVVNSGGGTPPAPPAPRQFSRVVEQRLVFGELAGG
jgi:hypothetical protein